MTSIIFQAVESKMIVNPEVLWFAIHIALALVIAGFALVATGGKGK